MHPAVATARRLAGRAWSALPEPVRASGAAARLRRRFGPLTEAPAAHPQPVDGEATAAPAPEDQIVVRTPEDLDAMVADLERRAAISDDELRAGFSRYRMEIELDLPADPMSSEYREAMFALYERIHGKPYDLSAESTPFDLDDAVLHPFPYATRSAATVGDQLIAIGYIIKTMALPPGAAVLDLGPGWGNTSLTLAQTGYRVTAVDVDPAFVELVRARAERLGVDLEVVQGDFSVAATLGKTFDAVLFYDSFHHSSDHLGLVRALGDVIAPGGKLVFAGEPISDALPFPWGLRLDGEAIYQIRSKGWLELGFTERYFRSMLERAGWQVDKRVCPDTLWGTVFVATRSDVDRTGR